LWLRTAKKDRKLSDLNGNIKCGNSLIDNQDIAGEKAFDWKTEFAEIMKNGGFDVVIGNPPYVDSESMTRFNPKDRDFISKNYKTAKGNWDLYIPFIEKGIILMKDIGYLSYITPNKWLSMPYGTELRKYVLDTIIQLSDFQKLKVFESASVFPITFSIRKETNNTLDIKIFNEKMEFVHYDLQKKDFNVSNFGFLLSKKIPILVNIKNQSHVLSQISDINGAFTTSEAYELIPYISNYEGQEKGTFLKLVNTGTIDKFTDLWDYEEVTYLKNKYVKPIVNIHDYKNKFQKRFQKYNNPKIIISGIRHFESFYDNNNEYLAGKSTTVLTNLKCYNYETITCILNSKLMEFYIKESYSTSGMDGGINFSPDLIRSLPIPVIDDVSLQKIKLLYDDLRIVYDNINKLKYNFAKIISSDFEISKPSGKIQKWYELNWNSFILEIKKLNGKLDKKKQLDWIDFFNENQNKIKHIINDSNCKIALINEFVYGLYNLSTEQILMLEDVS